MKKSLLRGNAAIIVLAVVAIIIAVGVTAVLMRPTMEEPSPSEMLPKATETQMEEKTTIKEEPMMEEKKDEMTKDEEVMNEPKELPAPTQQGSYEAYSTDKIARATNGDVVLFFHAQWCPYCRALDADINTNLSAIPDGLTILKTDYDKEGALKQKYGVTYQHTLVQVDAQGNLIKKWSGSQTLSALTEQVQ